MSSRSCRSCLIICELIPHEVDVVAPDIGCDISRIVAALHSPVPNVGGRHNAIHLIIGTLRVGHVSSHVQHLHLAILRQVIMMIHEALRQ